MDDEPRDDIDWDKLPKPKGHDWDERAAFARLRERMQQTPVRPMRLHTPAVVRRRYVVPILVATAAAAAIVFTAISMPERKQPAPPDREIVTQRGERATIDLADGTHVILAPASRLTIPGGFPVTRDLHLEGEAHFTVSHDSTRPFSVKTSNAVTRDIGTAFLVTAYSKSTRVIVTDGSVAFNTDTLSKNDLAQVDSLGVLTRRSNVKTAAYLAWTRDTLVFDATTLAEAIPQLERWFDININVADQKVRDRRLTGRFAHGSTTRLVEALSVALDVRIQRAGSTVMIGESR